MAGEQDDRLFRDLAEGTRAAIAIAQNNKLVYVNATSETLTGYLREEWAELPLKQLVSPADLPKYRRFFREVYVGRVPIAQFEAQILIKGGGTAWVEVSVSRIDYHSAPALLMTAFDITDRKRTEAAMRESQELFRTLAEATNAAIFLYRGERHVYANSAAARISGYSVEELLAMPYVETVHPDYREMIKERAKSRLRAEPAPTRYQLPLLTKSGEVRWVDYTGNAIEYQGQPAGLGTAFDITELRQAQETLRQYAKRLELLSEIDRASLTSRSKHEIASKALSLLSELVPADVAVVTEAERDLQWHSVIASHPPGEILPAIGRRMHMSAWVRTHANWRSGIDYIPNLDELRVLSTVQRSVREMGIRSYVNVPLFVQERVAGFLVVGNKDCHCYPSEHLEILQEVAQRLAIALHNARLFADLEVNQRNLVELSKRLVKVQEVERRNIARELHDEVAQTLTALHITLDFARRQSAEQRELRLDEAQALLADLSSRVRELSLNLRPAMLDDFGLVPTLLWYFERLGEHHQLCVEFEHQGVDHRFDPEVETVIYRIVQEALTNVARHAGVGEATVHLWASPTTISVQIEDSGRGFDPTPALRWPSGNGLTSMRERARLLGGQCVIESQEGAGTCVTALLPIHTGE